METVQADKGDKRRKVYIKLVFLQIGEIDTLKETFSADVFVQARWREPALDHSKAAIDVPFNSYWNPKILIQNALSTSKHAVWRMLEPNAQGETFVLEKHRIKGVFMENMELALFPFDIQELQITITTELAEDELVFHEDPNELSSVHVDTFAKQQEWDLMHCVVCTDKETTKEYANPKFKNPGLHVNGYARRRYGFFVWNVILLKVVITSMALTSFAVKRSLTPNRLQLSFMLILTGVTFKFVTNQIIPKISYVTHLDRHIVGSMMFVYLVTLFHALVTLVSDEDTASTVDYWGFVGFIILFFILQITFIIGVVISGYRRWSQVARLDAEYQEKAKTLLDNDTSNSNRRSRFQKIRSRKVINVP